MRKIWSAAGLAAAVLAIAACGSSASSSSTPPAAGASSPAAGSASLSQLQAFERQLTAANGPVEDAVIVLRSQLGLPPPDTG